MHNSYLFHLSNQGKMEVSYFHLSSKVKTKGPEKVWEEEEKHSIKFWSHSQIRSWKSMIKEKYMCPHPPEMKHTSYQI